MLERETLHVMDDVRRIAMVETKTIDESAAPFTPTARVRYQLGNHLGSAALELDDEGAIVSYEEYHPYGTSAYRAVDDSVEVSAKRYRYTGKERDEETGLYYHGARYYAPWLGWWTSADPAGLVDGVNLYRYAHGNPTQFVDPSGNQSQSLDVYSSPGHEVAEHPQGGMYAVSDSETAHWDPRQVDSVPADWVQGSDQGVQPPKPTSTPKPRNLKTKPADPIKTKDTSPEHSDSQVPEKNPAQAEPVEEAGPGRIEVEEPSFGESLIPIWGSGKSAIHHFQNGNWGRGAFYTAMAVSDLFLVKSVATIGGKLAIRGATAIGSKVMAFGAANEGAKTLGRRLAGLGAGRGIRSAPRIMARLGAAT